MREDTVLEDTFSKLFVLFILPACTTACVCLEVPEAMFVNAQAASNCNDDLHKKYRLILFFFNYYQLWHIWALINFSFHWKHTAVELL